MIYPIEKKPIGLYPKRNVWDVSEDKIEESSSRLKFVFFRRSMNYPKRHIFNHDFLLSLDHLRHCMFLSKSVLHRSTSSHELVCQSLNPRSNNQPSRSRYFDVLVPTNLVFQFDGLSDDQAKRAFDLYLIVLSEGILYPDIEFRSAQLETLRYLQENISKIHSKESVEKERIQIESAIASLNILGRSRMPRHTHVMFPDVTDWLYQNELNEMYSLQSKLMLLLVMDCSKDHQSRKHRNRGSNKENRT